MSVDCVVDHQSSPCAAQLDLNVDTDNIDSDSETGAVVDENDDEDDRNSFVDADIDSYFAL